jgi:hypothetical protein
MSLIFPTFDPVIGYSMVDIGKYVSDDSSVLSTATMDVKSQLKPGGIGSYVIRADHTTVSSAGEVEKTLAVYTVVRGNLEEFTVADKQLILARVRAMFSDGNLVRLERGER